MKLTLCIFLTFACLVLSNAYPAEEVKSAPEDIAPIPAELDGAGGEDASVRGKRHYGGYPGGYGGGYGKLK